MRIVLIADAYPPMRTSGAIQLRDLAQELFQLGHKPTVLVPSSDIGQPWLHEEMNGVEVLRLKSPRTKDIGYVRRTIGEFLMPFTMLRNIRKSPFSDVRWDGVVWYSPTIFLGPIANALKRASGCRSYLIVRDIFPEWAVDMEILRKGLVYRFFKMVERYQYSVADTIGVQSVSNLGYFAEWKKTNPDRRLEVLQNWLTHAPNVGSSISIEASPLTGRTIFVYAGNMGIAQGMDIILDLAERLRNRQDIGFLFVGRGSEVARLQAIAGERALGNIVFHDEVDPREISGLLAQCHIGLVALDPRHKTHNVPGKFLTYMLAGLPVLARVNAGNDLVDLISNEGVGRVYVGNSLDDLQKLAVELCDDEARRARMSQQARSLAQNLFSTTTVAKKIISALSRK
jgi:glycosyltransferase involved in cell wall biosynthesis